RLAADGANARQTEMEARLQVRTSLGAAAAAEAVALALPLAGRLPGCAVLATPVGTLVEAWGEAAVPALVCGTAALALLCHAGRTLTQASAHAPTGAPD
ncbi:hypothetical protein ACWDZ8_46105, partial [Streptomyces sp. NPDC003233]